MLTLAASIPFRLEPRSPIRCEQRSDRSKCDAFGAQRAPATADYADGKHERLSAGPRYAIDDQRPRDHRERHASRRRRPCWRWRARPARHDGDKLKVYPLAELPAATEAAQSASQPRMRRSDALNLEKSAADGSGVASPPASVAENARGDFQPLFRRLDLKRVERARHGPRHGFDRAESIAPSAPFPDDPSQRRRHRHEVDSVKGRFAAPAFARIRSRSRTISCVDNRSSKHRENML